MHPAIATHTNRRSRIDVRSVTVKLTLTKTSLAVGQLETSQTSNQLQQSQTGYQPETSQAGHQLNIT